MGTATADPPGEPTTMRTTPQMDATSLTTADAPDFLSPIRRRLRGGGQVAGKAGGLGDVPA
ncbi:hypothetical protein STRIP9103_06702 [Streptomyces ipomoeae 91-03]|uniref:Uncharacterized protein n=1 Tax=Streptomyces ipomoeae 91-03 TaxID=698759 RepID=L1KIK6_9ACTN|nr:hypothetical protein STRIP9103_06702 [Streptomyces ipomoeae 91-03]